MAVQEDDEMTEGGASANDLEAVERVRSILRSMATAGRSRSPIRLFLP